VPSPPGSTPPTSSSTRKRRGATFERCEVRSSELQDIAGVERLDGVRMPWPDVVQIAGLLAKANGIEVVD